MSTRFVALAAAALLCLNGCGSEAPDSKTDQASKAPTPTDESPAVEPSAFSGTYRVSGRTVETQSHRGRDIDGTVVITQVGDGYTASFKLTTLFPTADGPTEAQVVGTGSGNLQGDELRGVADTQIILAQVPGVNADFGFLPRRYGPRIRSQSVSRLDENGSLVIEIENEAAEGAAYRGTRTTLRGDRITTARAGP